ncbi:MAG TPA: pitrilysin family protein [Thermotogota bacterium]|nr:pitrilysin family protein [Thermotogota bacterium]HPJ88063.1 pitrilysin family protein [Thermotogota bacterium]HPR96248.1 pitrilysin family protein [Thermotogota bacterium]
MLKRNRRIPATDREGVQVQIEKERTTGSDFVAADAGNGVYSGLTEKNDGNTAVKTNMPNGMQVFSQQMHGVRSVSLSIAVKAGSSNEPADASGAAHFTEHMVFKGTHKRTAKELKEPIERVGGTLNAFTGKENTVYFARVPDSQSDAAVSILKDLCSGASFKENFFNLEKQVVLEEISAADDDPSDIVYEQFFQNIWGESKYGKPVLGNLETVSGMSRDDLVDFYRSEYIPSNMVFSIAGNFADDFFANFDEFDSEKSIGEREPLIYRPEKFMAFSEKEDLKQLHMLVGLEAPSRRDGDFNAFQVLNTLLGGGMSSKLFNRLREELGLVYTVDSGLISYPDGGLFFVYAATTPERYKTLITELMNELRKIMKQGITSQEISYGKERLKGKLLLSTESTYSTMMRNLDTGLAFGSPLSVEEMVEKIEAVDKEQIQQVMEKYFTREWVMSIVAPKKSASEIYHKEWDEKGIIL